ncbi:Uncharacterised protein [uncultured archaeon]|nr:Uncharacterised protein [uncultured archaeon]
MADINNNKSDYTIKTTVALLGQSMDNLKESFAGINKRLDDLPDEIIGRLNETIDLKIQTKVQNLENRINHQVIGLTISIIGTLVGVIISIAMQFINKG